MRSLSFSKYQSGGNDFLLVDDREGIFPLGDRAYVCRLCHRRLGVGADGLLLLQRSLCADFKMHVFNADGSEPAMCGNGLRCLAYFLEEKGLSQEALTIEVGGRVWVCSWCTSARSKKRCVRIDFGSAKVHGFEMPICLEGETVIASILDTGVPHAVVFVEDVGAIDVERLGRQIRFHEAFAPEGVNANFAATASGKIVMRTYERGVEAETPLCGTGAAAVALAAVHCRGVPSPLHVCTMDGEGLDIFVDDSHRIASEGTATRVFHGELWNGSTWQKRM